MQRGGHARRRRARAVIATGLAAVLLGPACSLARERDRYCRESTESGFCRPERIAIERLIARAGAHHGRRVKVRGYAHLAVDNSGLYPTQEDCDEWRSQRGLWLEVPARGADPLDRMVEVEGTFDRANRGHQGHWAGAITHVFRLKPIADEPR
ncbi:MAG: hypothetical protein JXR83_05175 [Deltaproteobacteria bacterium]|nr:hypothetical protein [Deltaproteobacteria bacterium]